MKLKRFVKYIPDSIRYNHYIHKLLFYKNNLNYIFDIVFRKKVELTNNHISLTVGENYQLPFKDKTGIKWTSDNDLVSIDKNGVLTARENAIGKKSNATIKAIRNGNIIKQYKITIVDWIANKSFLQIKDIYPAYKLLTKHNNKIYFSISKNLYVTEDGFKSKQFQAKLPVLPAQSPPMLITPKGFFLIGQRQIFWTEDLKKWFLVQKVNLHGVKNSFDYYYDEKSKSCYVYYAEYSCINSNRHKVYRGIINSSNKQTWDIILDFYSIDEYNNDKSLLLQTARHIHTVKVDSTNGMLLVGVGDEDEHSKILYSLDNGESFNIMGMGSQDWRTLSIWFTTKYIYWNMDSHEPQKIFRTSKKALIDKKINNIESLQNISEVVNSPKQIVSELSNGAMFASCDVIEEYGSKITIMATAPEGCIRDMQGRVYGIEEKPDERVVVQELISVSSKDESADYKTNMFTQLIPEFQDEKGYIYFSTRNLKHNGIIQAKLIWNIF